jgi:hypothetical protein
VSEKNSTNGLKCRVGLKRKLIFSFSRKANKAKMTKFFAFYDKFRICVFAKNICIHFRFCEKLRYFRYFIVSFSREKQKDHENMKTNIFRFNPSAELWKTLGKLTKTVSLVGFVSVDMVCSVEWSGMERGDLTGQQVNYIHIGQLILQLL